MERPATPTASSSSQLPPSPSKHFPIKKTHDVVSPGPSTDSAGDQDTEVQPSPKPSLTTQQDDVPRRRRRSLRFGGHSLKEAGTSMCFPPVAVLIWRLVIFLGLLGTLVVTLVVFRDEENDSFEMILFYPRLWNIGLNVSFFFQMLATVLYMRRKAMGRDTEEAHLVGSLAVFLFQTSSSMTIGVNVLGALYGVYMTIPYVVASVLDLVLTMRMEFRGLYCMIVIAVGVIISIVGISFPDVLLRVGIWVLVGSLTMFGLGCLIGEIGDGGHEEGGRRRREEDEEAV